MSSYGSRLLVSLLVLLAASSSVIAQQIDIALPPSPLIMDVARGPLPPPVRNRAKVSVHLTGLSPLDLCTIPASSVTATAETSALESLVSSISSFGALGNASGSAIALPAPGPGLEAEIESLNAPSASGNKAPHKPKPQGKNEILDEKFLQLINRDLDVFAHAIDNIRSEQNSMRGDLQAAADTLKHLPLNNYRGDFWKNFATDADIHKNDSLSKIEVPKLDAAANALADLKIWLPLLHKDWDQEPSNIAPLSEAQSRANEDDTILGQATDRNKTLAAAQQDLQKALDPVKLAEDAFEGAYNKTIFEQNDKSLVQDLPVPTERKATATLSLTCVSRLTGKPTLNPVQILLLYQDIPHLTASVGFVTSFLKGQEINISEVYSAPGTPPAPTSSTEFTATTLRPQVIPMAFLNYALPFYKIVHFPNVEDTHFVTANLSGGFGVNPNSGTNEPEGFTGIALGYDKLLIHMGAHFGRTQQLANGFVLNTPLPSTFTATSAPVNTQYHVGFAIGFSVRIAPY